MTQTPPSAASGTLCVIATLICWSVVPLFLFHFAEYIDVWTSNGWRYAVAAVFWLPVLLVGSRQSTSPGLWRASLVPSVFNILGQVCFAMAHYHIDPGLVTFGLRFQIVCVTIGAALLFPNERAAIRRPLFLLGLVMVIGGTVSTIWNDADFGNPQNTFGVVLALAAGAFFAGYSISVRKCLSGRPPIVAFAAISQITALVMIGLMLVYGERSGLAVFDMSGSNLVLLAVSAIIGIAFGHVLFYISMARLGVAAASGVLQLQPFGTAIGATIFFHEPLAISQWVGGTVAVAGAMVILSVQSRVMRQQRAADTDEPEPVDARNPRVQDDDATP